jgi:adenylosuccinate synthase
MLKSNGIEYEGRIFISDRAHIVFDFHQAVDGFQENNLGGSKIGTTLKGIGPAYSSKAQRNGLRLGDLIDMAYFETRLKSLASAIERSYPGIHVDIAKEIQYYLGVRDFLLPMVKDTITLCHQAWKAGKRILIEGANATSKYLSSQIHLLSPLISFSLSSSD